MAFEREEKRHISVSKVETNIDRRILNQFSQIAQARLFFLHLLSSNPLPVISPHLTVFMYWHINGDQKSTSVGCKLVLNLWWQTSLSTAFKSAQIFATIWPGFELYKTHMVSRVRIKENHHQEIVFFCCFFFLTLAPFQNAKSHSSPFD